ncbi:type II toxin-antitoxin system YafO family toxin [Vibrio alginolyticus]|uniref:type II toxin-antitoxin system YafO family toxin n=1 Tax=Vibrio alginolyticus TaxID=663 RepID=UPI003550052A
MEFDFPRSVRIDDLYTRDTTFKVIVDKFAQYKKDSDPKEFATPTRHMQNEYIGILPELFGRDRFFKNPPHARKEDLIHLHIWREPYNWIDPEDGDYLVQWECKSDTYLVYSYFKHKNKHVFYLIAFLDRNAHKETKDLPNNTANPLVLEWLREAKSYRESYQSVEQNSVT